jgi:hypothetical protein
MVNGYFVGKVDKVLLIEALTWPEDPNSRSHNMKKGYAAGPISKLKFYKGRGRFSGTTHLQRGQVRKRQF